MIVIGGATAVGFVVFFPALLLLGVRLRLNVLLEAIGVAAGLAVLAALNLRFGLFAQKGASEFAYTLHETSDYFGSLRQFGLQALVNWPAFSVLDRWEAAIGGNIAITSLVYAYAVSKNPSSRRFLLAPAVVNFSMFALRDPLIGVLMFMLVLLMMEKNSTKLRLALPAIFTATVLTRPENLILVAGCLAALTYIRSTSIPLRVASSLAFVSLALFALRFGPSLLGVPGQVSILDAPVAMTEFFESRATRHDATDGNASAILGGRLVSLPFPIRYPVQLVTFVVLPLPFEIRSLTGLLAFVDSIYLIAMYRRMRTQISSEAKIACLVFVLCTAPFISNYGNAFRLRLPIYFMLAAGLIVNKALNTNGIEQPSSPTHLYESGAKHRSRPTVS